MTLPAVLVCVMLLWNKVLFQYFNTAYVCKHFADPRVENWLMMQSYVPTLCVVGVYLIVATVGPRIMANRKPINVQLPMQIYNLCLVLLSVYMFHEVSYYNVVMHSANHGLPGYQEIKPLLYMFGYVSMRSLVTV